MKALELRTPRLLLDAPREYDVDAIAAYCRDPLFERFMTLPWPYTRADAESFVREYVPNGWATGREATWALRRESGGPLLGVIGVRLVRHDVGFWLGAPHRGLGYMAEALDAVVHWAFARLDGVDDLRWECVAGNQASAAVARRAGFAFTHIGPAMITARDGSHPSSWHASRRRSTDAVIAAASWPEEITAR